jgi:hypothetical protein
MYAKGGIKMEIVINIPEKRYKDIQRIASVQFDRNYFKTAEQIIANGTPLPKCHGRLGDLDALETEMVNGIHAGNYEEGYEEYGHINNMEDCVECVKYADTIIEADKESELNEHK